MTQSGICCPWTNHNTGCSDTGACVRSMRTNKHTFWNASICLGEITLDCQTRWMNGQNLQKLTQSWSREELQLQRLRWKFFQPSEQPTLATVWNESRKKIINLSQDCQKFGQGPFSGEVHRSLWQSPSSLGRVYKWTALNLFIRGCTVNHWVGGRGAAGILNAYPILDHNQLAFATLF